MSLSVRTRFEIFKRDNFTCSYCGKRPPDVLLEVDHIIPRAAGGSDDADNLTTACWECNSGKSDRLLDEGTSPAVTRRSLEDAQERADQARAYAEAISTSRQLQDQFYWMVIDSWARYFGAELVETEDSTVWRFDGKYVHGRFPNEASLRRILRRLPVDEVMEAVDITASKFRWANQDAERYLFGICWRKIDAREGR